MKAIFYSLVMLSFLACSTSKNETEKLPFEEAPATGQEVIMDVVDILKDAQNFNDKPVAISGIVVHVCKHSGKRLHLMGKDEQTQVRLEAGAIGQFDRELEGSEIIARGVFHREVIDEDYLAKWSGELEKEGMKDHTSPGEQAEEKGQIQQYRSMMKETEDGRLENCWIEGISFETVTLH